MSSKKKPADDTPRPDVTIYPTGDAWIPDVPAVEQTVSAERADELLAYSPPAFTLEQPAEPETPKATGGPVTGPISPPVGESGAETTSTPDQPPADAAGTDQEV